MNAALCFICNAVRTRKTSKTMGNSRISIESGFMNISCVTRLTGASQKAIRNYEAIGLIHQVQRRGKYRVYTMNDVNLVRLIRTAQKLGFKLSELATLTENGNLPTWRGVLELVEKKHTVVQQELVRLDQLCEQLSVLRTELHDCLESTDEEINLKEIDCDLISKNSLFPG